MQVVVLKINTFLEGVSFTGLAIYLLELIVSILWLFAALSCYLAINVIYYYITYLIRFFIYYIFPNLLSCTSVNPEVEMTLQWATRVGYTCSRSRARVLMGRFGHVVQSVHPRADFLFFTICGNCLHVSVGIVQSSKYSLV